MALEFERRPRESEKAFGAFRDYLSQGPERSLAKVATRVGRRLGQVERWSARFGWSARVAAYTEHLALVERQAGEAVAAKNGVDWVKRQEEHREAEWQARCELVELARTAIERWKARADRCGSLEGIARLLELASKLGRLSSGLPTEVKEVNEKFAGKLDVEWEIALRKAYGPKEEAKAIDVEEVAAAPEREVAAVVATTN